jgi:hypothetical protein
MSKPKCFGKMDLLEVKCDECSEEIQEECYNKSFEGLKTHDYYE